MSSKSGQIRPRTAELAALERLKKFPRTYNGENDVITFSLLFSDRILFILAGIKKDIHKSLDEFESRPDPTTKGLAALELLKMMSPHFLDCYCSDPYQTFA